MAKNNNTSMLWIDTQAQLSDAQLAVFYKQGLTITQATSTDLEDKHYMGIDVVSVNLHLGTQMLEQIRLKQRASKTSAAVIARVQRDQLELGIQAMNQGALTVLAADNYNPVEWVEAISSVNLKQHNKPNAFVFVDPVSRNLLALCERVAQVDISVLLTGPTGVGKEVLAQILHDTSPRYKGPFVAFNCAAMPENLIEDMLFGHEKGSFTGATKVQPGLFEQAQSGTIFLDEIGEMPFNLQAKLLRILQERTVVRLGGQKPISLDIRVIAATNRNLKHAIAQRTFREDLYFRLSAFKLTIPPLRDRPLDIVPLVELFIAQQSVAGNRVQLTAGAQRRLITYRWPGNVRELQNVIVRAMVLSNQLPIDVEHLVFDDIDQIEEQDAQQIVFQATTKTINGSGGSIFAQDVEGGRSQRAYRGGQGDNLGILKKGISERACEDLNQAIKNSECQTIMAALRSSHNRDQAAEKLGISPRTLRHKLQKLREQGIELTRAYAR